jgi:hypothetical protein
LVDEVAVHVLFAAEDGLAAHVGRVDLFADVIEEGQAGWDVD